MEYIKLTLILELVITRAAVCNEHKHINAVFSGFFMETCNYMLNKFVAESIGEYSYPLVHYLFFLRVRSVHHSFDSITYL